MGIKGLAKLLSDEAPESIREVPLSSLHGRKIAVDASMQIYQFLIAVRQGGPNSVAQQLTNADGEATSHIQGVFNRTIRFMTEGIRPVYVFDGKPPNIKSGELTKRKEKREKAQKELEAAKESGNVEEIERQEKRLVRAGEKENKDCMKLLALMGVPVLKAPCEAEAQCAALAKKGLVYASATEDMDTLTFQTPILLRKMTFASAGKQDIQTINYEKAIAGLEITHDQFVDLCILLGCDYCDSIRNIGPKTALKLIREHKNIETIIQNIDSKKYGIPENYYASKDEDGEEIPPIFVSARTLFNDHEVNNDVKLKWEPCQVEELTKYLVDDMGFNADRVKSSVEKLQKAFKATAKPQTRMDSFFKVLPTAGPKKRKVEDKKGKKGAAKKKR